MGLLGKIDVKDLAVAVLGPDEARKLAIWRMCTPIPPHDANEWGICAGGKVVRYSKHGDRSSRMGGKFDHYPVPKMRGGTDDIANLRPLHWSLNSRHGGLLSATGYARDLGDETM